jgi:Protein of unknown function (DUF3710)
VSIFRRNKATEGTEPSAEGTVDPAGTTDGFGTDDADATAERADDTDAGSSLSREDGPFDHAEVDGREDRVDLGALWVRGVPGMELRLEVDQQSQQVNAATVVLGESALQVQAFAAPRSSGLWDEVRAEITQAVERQGGTIEEHDGAFGTALRTRMPSESGGRTVFAPATFLGVDGPRWFLRGVLSGRAAIDEEAAGPLLDVFRTLVVVRGVEPMAPRELLPLRLPTDPRAEAAEGDDDEQPRRADPFERGPEITEVR